MDTDVDTEPWVGTVKSIQAQADDDSQEVAEEITNDAADEDENVNEDEAIASQEEEDDTKTGEEDNDAFVDQDNIRQEVVIEDIALKLEESEDEKPQEGENYKTIAIENDDKEQTCATSKTVLIESVENIVGESETCTNTEHDIEVVDEVDVKIEDESDSTIGRVTPVEHQFKTPPRPARLSVMPPTPPESSQGTPPQQVNNLVIYMWSKMYH